MSRKSSGIACLLVALTLSAPTVLHGQGLSGLYLQNQSIGRGDAWNYYYFWPDGHLCEVMPKGGFGPGTTYAQVAQQAPTSCGTYALRGATLELQVAGRPVALNVSHVGSEISLSNFPTIRVPAFPNDARLSGQWGTLIIRGDDYRNETFTFTPDGRFVFDDVRVRAEGAPTRRLEGTYRISGNTLQVMTQQGAQTLSIHPFPQDRRISIDGNVLQPK